MNTTNRILNIKLWIEKMKKLFSGNREERKCFLTISEGDFPVLLACGKNGRFFCLEDPLKNFRNLRRYERKRGVSEEIYTKITLAEMEKKKK